MQTSLRGIARKAKQNSKYKFGNLYGMLNKQALYLAWLDINKNAAAGVDKETAKEFKKNLEVNLETLEEELKTKRYKARLVKRVNIPKGDGKVRPLGLPALRDKIVQRATARILEAIYEQDFLESSYGYRPGKNAQKAASDLTRELIKKYNYVVEADIRGFFDAIDHDWLIKMLELRIKDSALTRLIKKWLKAGVLNTDGQVINPETGCPQGAVISPILANVYLHYALDIWVERTIKPLSKGEVYISRFADDFVCGFRIKEEAMKFYRTLGKRLEKYGLKLAEEKTKVINFSRFNTQESTSFDFLGFEFRWKQSRKGKRYIGKRTSRSKLRKSLKAFTKWSRENRHKPIKRLVEMINAKLRGYFNYYGVIGNYDGLKDFYEPALKILYKWLRRRGQRKRLTWKKFREQMKRYGLITPRITEIPDNQLRLVECFV